MSISQIKPLAIESFEIVKKLIKSKYYRFYQISNTDTDQNYLAKICTVCFEDLSKKELLGMSREINIISKINHPSFLNFIGIIPNNFKNKPKAVFIMDYPENLFLSDHISKITNTQKFIIIYGIAAGMSFLHSNDVIHRSLNPYNIYLDDKFYPKISGMGQSIQIPKSDTFISELSLDSWTYYFAPEIFLNLEYSKSADVYSFAISMYEILTNKEPFEFTEFNDFYEKVGQKGFRPEIDESIPSCYKRLIEKCWSQDPKNRPTFDEIFSELENNSEYVTCFESDFDSEALLKYKKYINESTVMYDTHEYKFDLFEELLKEKSQFFNKSDEMSKRLKYSDSEVYINLDDYEEKSPCELVHKKTGINYCVRKLKNLSEYLRNDIATIAFNVNAISRFDHPSIIKFCGFSQFDFNNEPNPFFITNKEDFNIPILYRTSNILITLYGIASGMAYLHSHNILHRDLKSSKISIDENGVPTIVGFGLSKDINEDKMEQNKKIKGTPAYIAPEVYLHKGYCKASDVYAFSLVVYELLTSEKPYNEFDDPKLIRSKVAEENFRPELTISLPKIYRELVEKCWSPDPKDRPTFEEIANDLKTNPGYLTDDIDKDNFFEFVKFIDEYPVKFDPLKKVKFFDDILKSKLHTFQDISPNFQLENMYQTEENDLSFNINYLDLNNLEFSTLIATGHFYEVKKIVDKKTNVVYASKKTVKVPYSKIFKQRFLRHDIINFSRELNILLQVNHPSILKFIGHCVLDEKIKASHLIVTEFSSKGSLDHYIRASNSEEKNKTEEEEEEEKVLNFTQKFCIIYGIASGMSYLHSNNILHRNLKPANIYLDDSLHPKISGFNISKEINCKKQKPNKSIKGTPIYIAPEIYLHKGYCKANDVYSFALIMYEILTETIPFSTISNPKEILTEIVEKNHRPQFTSEIPKKYQELIERCWSPDPDSRPTFDQIVNELKSNNEYMINDIDKDEIQKYFDFIDKSEASFNISNKINQLDEYVKFKISKFKRLKTKVNRRNVWETESNDVSFDLDFINLRNFEKKKLIYKEENFKYHEVIDTKTNKLYISKQTDKKGDSIDKLFSEIDKISQINHPSILRFIGYSTLDFKNRPYPVLLNENASNGSLDRIFQFENIHEIDSIIDDTKKLIILYGIAAGMAHLHSHEIAHGNLNPTNIYLDDFLFVKISGFENSKKKSINSPLTKVSLSPLKIALFFKTEGSNRYKSPESLLTKKVHPVYDVYSFAMIAYQLITGLTPFKNAFSDRKEAYRKIYIEGFRPEFPESTPNCYKKLIEKCWSKELNERPTFDEIVYHLRTNKEFITDKVNKDEFENYVQYIDKSQNQLNKYVYKVK